MLFSSNSLILGIAYWLRQARQEQSKMQREVYHTTQMRTSRLESINRRIEREIIILCREATHLLSDWISCGENSAVSQKNAPKFKISVMKPREWHLARFIQIINETVAFYKTSVKILNNVILLIHIAVSDEKFDISGNQKVITLRKVWYTCISMFIVKHRFIYCFSVL